MDPATLNQRLATALEHHKANRLADAEAIYRRILADHPHNVDALHLQALIEANRGRLDAALSMLQRAVALMPTFVECVRDLGQVLAAMGRHDEAIAAFARAVQLNPRNAISQNELASALAARGRFAEALQPLRAAVELEPNNAAHAANFGYALARLGHTDQAIQAMNHAIKLDPRFAPAWLQLAEAFWRAGRYADSIAPARHAVELMPDNPHGHLVYGNTLQVAGEFEQAAAEYRRVTQLAPSLFDAHNNLALTTLKMGEAHEAARMYEQIRARWPNERDALANQSLTLLTLGNFEQGLAHYEARTTLDFLEPLRRSGKLWDGRDIAGRTIVLASEQGFGDTIQFIRYASLIAQRGGKVIAGSPPELIPVINTVPGLERVLPNGTAMPPCDFVAPMGSLPRIFGTRIDTIPANVPYMFAEPARVEQWRTRLTSDARIKVGIVWAGSTAHQNDRARSCRLTDFAPLAVVENVMLCSLQKGVATGELASAPFRVVALGDDLNDFGDTAGLLMNLDLLISVDTSVVHLAGAMARPVWTIIARGPDWRWMLEREDTPWYPTMRLFRQKTLKQWGDVFARVAGELRTFVKERRA